MSGEIPAHAKSAKRLATKTTGSGIARYVFIAVKSDQTLIAGTGAVVRFAVRRAIAGTHAGVRFAVKCSKMTSTTTGQGIAKYVHVAAGQQEGHGGTGGLGTATVCQRGFTGERPRRVRNATKGVKYQPVHRGNIIESPNMSHLQLESKWPNKRAGGDGGMTVLFHAERPWPAAPHHGR